MSQSSMVLSWASWSFFRRRASNALSLLPSASNSLAIATSLSNKVSNCIGGGSCCEQKGGSLCVRQS